MGFGHVSGLQPLLTSPPERFRGGRSKRHNGGTPGRKPPRTVQALLARLVGITTLPVECETFRIMVWKPFGAATRWTWSLSEPDSAMNSSPLTAKWTRQGPFEVTGTR